MIFLLKGNSTGWALPLSTNYRRLNRAERVCRQNRPCKRARSYLERRSSIHRWGYASPPWMENCRTSASRLWICWVEQQRNLKENISTTSLILTTWKLGKLLLAE